MCDCCALKVQYPDLTKRTYSQGCNYCAARYLHDGGEADITKWSVYGVDPDTVNALRRRGELIDPAVRGKRKQ